jgi:hypothetical protein
MTYHAEVAKEFLRDAFMKGTLDITDSFGSVRGFVVIFAGEMEALVAIQNCRFLSRQETEQLVKLAAPTAQTRREFKAWYEHATA